MPGCSLAYFYVVILSEAKNPRICSCCCLFFVSIHRKTSTGAPLFISINFRLTTLGPHHKTRHFDRRRRFCRRSGETRFSTSTLRQPASSNAASRMTDLTQVKSCQSRVQNLILTAVETPAIPAATQPFQPPRGPLEASSKSSRETLLPQPRAHPHQPEISSRPAPGSSGSQTEQAR